MGERLWNLKRQYIFSVALGCVLIFLSLTAFGSTDAPQEALMLLGALCIFVSFGRFFFRAQWKITDFSNSKLYDGKGAANAAGNAFSSWFLHLDEEGNLLPAKEVRQTQSSKEVNWDGPKSKR